MKRSGSTLQFLIAKRIIEITGAGASFGFAEDQEMIDFILSDSDKSYKFSLIKTHNYFDLFAKLDYNDKAIFLYSYRDIRDVFVSSMTKWFNGNFENCYYNLNSNLQINDQNWRKLKNIYISSYEALTSNLEQEIIKISKFLGISLSNAEVNSIYSELKLDSVKKSINNFDYTNKGIKRNAGEIDPETNLHKNHINSGEIDQWKKKLSYLQILIIQSDWKKWLIENNYSIYKPSLKENLIFHINSLYKCLIKEIKNKRNNQITSILYKLIKSKSIYFFPLFYKLFLPKIYINNLIIALGDINTEFLCTKEVEICIEGFPRSANSYAVRMFLYANPNVTVAHHTHMIQNIKIAQYYKIPTIILIREPVDAIASLSIYNNSNDFDSLIEMYISFYSYILKIRTKVLIIDYNKVITDINGVISMINNKFKTSFSSIEDIGLAKNSVKKDIIHHSKGKYKEESSFKIPLPDKKREGIKEQISSELKKKEKIKYTMDIYSKLITASKQERY